MNRKEILESIPEIAFAIIIVVFLMDNICSEKQWGGHMYSQLYSLNNEQVKLYSVTRFFKETSVLQPKNGKGDDFWAALPI